MLKKIKEMLCGSNGKNAVVLLAAVGLVFLILPEMIDFSQNNISQDPVSDEIKAYSASLEENLRDAVCRVVGSDNVSVMITLESTFENVYVSDAVVNEAVTAEKTDRQSEKQLVLTGAGADGGMPVVVKKIPPKVKGAVIVCENGNNSDIKMRVTALAATALSLSETKIYVTGGDQYGKH